MPHGPQRAYYTITRPIPGVVIVTRRASFDGILVVVHRRWFFGPTGVDRAARFIYGRS